MLGRPIIGWLEAIEGAVILYQQVLQLTNGKVVTELTQQISQMNSLNWKKKKANELLNLKILTFLSHFYYTYSAQ